MGYGKSWESMYTGSMYGSSTAVFAVWGYVFSHMRIQKNGEATSEVNPIMLAGVFNTTPEAVVEALVELEKPDPHSRHEDEEGRRIVLLGRRHLGPMLFRVVNGKTYRNTRDERSATESKRRSQAKWRAKRRAKAAAKENGAAFDESEWERCYWEAEEADAPLAVQRPMDRGVGQ